MSKTKKNCYVAMLDVMGFKSIVESKEKIVDVYQLLARVDDANKGMYQAYKYDCFNFSDTVIITSNSDHDYDLFLISLMCSQYMRIFIESGIGINGAISKGVVIVDKEKNICFGEPISKAYQLMESSSFYGIVIDENITATNSTIQDIWAPNKKEGWKKQKCYMWQEKYEQHIEITPNNISISMDRITAELMKKRIQHIIAQSNLVTDNKIGRGMNYIINTEIILKRWYDSNGDKWGDLTSIDFDNPLQASWNNPPTQNK